MSVSQKCLSYRGVLERSPSYRKRKKESQERQGVTLVVRFTGVHLIEMFVKTKSTVYTFDKSKIDHICHFSFF